MYKYIAEDDKKKLQALNTYYKTLYNRIAIIVLVIGLCLLPFLRNIIKLDTPIDNLEIYYLVLLLETVCSYLFVYKTTIVSADQRAYRLKIVTSILEVVKSISQIIILVITKNYLFYLLISLANGFIANFVRSKMSEKWYPFIKEKAELDENERKEIWTGIKSMFCYKVSGVVAKSTDNILISLLVNTTMVGIYSNYNMIFNKIEAFINLIFGSIMASVGNMNVTSSKEEKYRIFEVFMFITFWLLCIASIGIFFIGEDIIRAVTGSEQYVLPTSILIVGLVNFYFNSMNFPTGTFRQTTGLFKMAKYTMLAYAILNLVLSVLFGKHLGLFGIILATFVSKSLTVTWREPYILYKHFFDKKISKYYITQLLRALLCVTIIILMIPILRLVDIGHLYIRILVKGIICCIIPNLILIIIYRNNPEFMYLKTKAIEIIKGVKMKMKN